MVGDHWMQLLRKSKLGEESLLLMLQGGGVEYNVRINNEQRCTNDENHKIQGGGGWRTEKSEADEFTASQSTWRRSVRLG